MKMPYTELLTFVVYAHIFRKRFNKLDLFLLYVFENTHCPDSSVLMLLTFPNSHRFQNSFTGSLSSK